MGNGHGLVIDFETIAYGKPVPGNPIIYMGNGLTQRWYPYPQYQGTPWADYARLTKRETAVAKIHTFLSKLGTLSFNEEEFNKVCSLSAKRLKRAKWAQYKNLVK